MARVRYYPAPEVCDAARIILVEAQLLHIDSRRIRCVRSVGSRSRALARIYGMPGAWRAALGWNPGYVIEVISENFDCIDPMDKVRVIVHELLHIPRSFSGGLRPHGKYVDDIAVSSIIELLERGGAVKELLKILGGRECGGYQKRLKALE